MEDIGSSESIQFDTQLLQMPMNCEEERFPFRSIDLLLFRSCCDL